MKAIVQPAYGSPDVLRFEEVDRPAVGKDDVLVRVHAAAVCKGDVHLLTGRPFVMRMMFGLRRPSRPIAGQDVAGRVVAVGERVTALKVGDAVYGQVTGGFAEYVCAPADRFAPKPVNLTFEQAASVPDSGMTALQALRAGGVAPGQSVLVNGASGGVGTFAVQTAKALGARVTAVCSTRHVEKLRAIGADRVIDYTREDFARSGERHDVMLDLVGNRALSDCRSILAPDGRFVSSAGGDPHGLIGPIFWLLQVILTGLFVSQKMIPFLTRPKKDDLVYLTSLIEAGAVTPVIERTYELREAAEAVRHVALGHAQGKTVIRVLAEDVNADRVGGSAHADGRAEDDDHALARRRETRRQQVAGAPVDQLIGVVHGRHLARDDSP